MEIKAAAEAVFREESGRIIATLIRISGSFDLAEEAMQESFASALAYWPAKGILRNPATLQPGLRQSYSENSSITAAANGQSENSRIHCAMKRRLSLSLPT